MIMTQYERAKTLLVTHRDALERIAMALIEREALSLEEVEAAIDGRPLPPVEEPLRNRPAATTRPTEDKPVRGLDLAPGQPA